MGPAGSDDAPRRVCTKPTQKLSTPEIAPLHIPRDHRFDEPGFFHLAKLRRIRIISIGSDERAGAKINRRSAVFWIASQ